jgi:hypothetical protein
MVSMGTTYVQSSKSSGIKNLDTKSVVILSMDIGDVAGDDWTTTMDEYSDQSDEKITGIISWDRDRFDHYR